MKTHVEELDGNLVRLTVTVPAEEVDKAIDTAYKRVAGKIKIPGFRTGKAPKPVIDTHVGREAVLADAQDEVLNESYGKALDAEKLRPIEQPEIGEFDALEPGTDFEYSAEVQVRPELTLGSLEGMEVTVPSRTATDAEIDAQIEQYRDRFAQLEPVEDRGVEKNDFVLISFVGKVDGEDYEGNVVDKFLYEMNRGQMPPEFDEGLIGMKPGEETQVAFEIPDTSSNPDYVGKMATFDVTVHEIKEKVLPEVDADFATNVGGFETVEDLRDALRGQIDRNKELDYHRALEDEARKALAERVEGDIPEPMIETAYEQIMRDIENSLKSQGLTVEAYLRATQTAPEQFMADTKVRAEDSVRQELALEALFRQKDFELTDADIDAEVRMFAKGDEESAAELRAKWEETGVMSVLNEQVMQKKAMEWLLDNVTIHEEGAEAEKSASEGKKPSKKKSKKADESATDESASDEDSKE